MSGIYIPGKMPTNGRGGRTMSIYIPGIAPPENCDKCTHPTCTLWQNHEPDGRHKDCPIIELHPHGDLIDRSKIVYTRDDSGLRSMDFARRAQLENVIPVIPAKEE